MTNIDTDTLANVLGGQSGNTGITGGLNVPNNKVPGQSSDPGYNTGITGGLNVPNNQVPRPQRPGNTGITGGIPNINNWVPTWLRNFFHR